MGGCQSPNPASLFEKQMITALISTHPWPLPRSCPSGRPSSSALGDPERGRVVDDDLCPKMVLNSRKHGFFLSHPPAPGGKKQWLRSVGPPSALGPSKGTKTTSQTGCTAGLRVFLAKMDLEAAVRDGARAPPPHLLKGTCRVQGPWKWSLPESSGKLGQ